MTAQRVASGEGGLFMPSLYLLSAGAQLPGVLEGPPVCGEIEPQELGPWKSFWRREDVSPPPRVPRAVCS